MLRLWVDAGFDLKTLDADAIRQAVSSRNEALAIYLIDAGVPVNPRPPAAPMATARRRTMPTSRRCWPPRYCARTPSSTACWPGRRPGRPGLGRAERAVLADRARQSGRAGSSAARRRAPGRSAPAPAPAPYALINAAAGSGDIALARRVAQATGRGWTAPACPTAANSVCSTDPVISPACSNWASTVAPPTAARRWDGACWRPCCRAAS